jgi:branched chain amino acid efflux pump
VLPVMVKTGSPAFLAIGATVAVMAIRRNEFLALAAGLAVAAMARAGEL